MEKGIRRRFCHDAQFMRDVIVGKVDDHTAICSMDVFDPEKCRQCLKIQR